MKQESIGRSSKLWATFGLVSLTPQHEIETFLESHSGWTRQGKAISKTYEFGGFGEAMGFVTRVGLMAEKVGHHPDIDIRWNKVTLSIYTHSEGGLTAQDLDFAETADQFIE